MNRKPRNDELYHAVTDKNKPFDMGNDMPHYSDSVFRYPVTVYFDLERNGIDYGQGTVVEDATYNYSDRISRWYENSTDIWITTLNQHNKIRTPQFYEDYLRTLTGLPNLELVHVQSSYNWSSGHPYQIFGYFENKEV